MPRYLDLAKDEAKFLGISFGNRVLKSNDEAVTRTGTCPVHSEVQIS
jgi:hypothetical protein